MGGKITIDSATLMNKGLELIEAHHLFGVPYDRIDVVIHPQSIVHAFVHLIDGASLAHLGYPDMRVPISYALHHPERAEVPVRTLDLVELGVLNFEGGRGTATSPAFAWHSSRRRRGTAPGANAATRSRFTFLRGELAFTVIAASGPHSASCRSPVRHSPSIRADDEAPRLPRSGRVTALRP